MHFQCISQVKKYQVSLTNQVSLTERRSDAAPLAKSWKVESIRSCRGLAGVQRPAASQTGCFEPSDCAAGERVGLPLAVQRKHAAAYIRRSNGLGREVANLQELMMARPAHGQLS